MILQNSGHNSKHCRIILAADSSRNEWSDPNVVVLTPNDVATGPVVVTVNGVSSNGALFTAN
jgi:hypothetical protein